MAHVIAGFPGSDQENGDQRETDLSEERFADIIARCKCLRPGEIEAVLKALGDILEVPIPRERLTVNWGEVREMAMHGISFGSHSCSHHLLTQLSHGEARREIEESDRLLRAMPCGYLPVFCYPNGDQDETIQQVVKVCNYAAAVSAQAGVETAKPENPFVLKRIGIHNDVSSTVSMFAFHLLRAALRW
jgi:sugar phosphate isomerase/epimerase